MKINIAKYLLELLLEHGEVTIPGIGRFELKNNPASFGEGRKSLMPPTKEFIFSEEHSSDDEVLKNHLIKNENIDAITADQFVDKFSSDILKGLLENKPVELAYLGAVNRNEPDGNVNFVQNEVTLSKLNKILPELSLPAPKSVGSIPKKELPVSESVPTKIASGNKVAEKKTTIDPNLKSAPINPDLSQTEKTGIAWWKWGLLALIFGAICILGMKMCSNENSNVYKSIDKEQAKPVAGEGEEIDGSVTDSAVVVDFSDSSIGGDKNGALEKTTAVTNKNISGGDCVVIVASMQNQGNITRLISEIENKSYEVYTESHGAYTRVGVQVDCDELGGSYKDFIRQVSRDFKVTAWSLKPEYVQ